MDKFVFVLLWKVCYVGSSRCTPGTPLKFMLKRCDYFSRLTNGFMFPYIVPLLLLSCFLDIVYLRLFLLYMLIYCHETFFRLPSSCDTDHFFALWHWMSFKSNNAKALITTLWSATWTKTNRQGKSSPTRIIIYSTLSNEVII